MEFTVWLYGSLELALVQLIHSISIINYNYNKSHDKLAM